MLTASLEAAPDLVRLADPSDEEELLAMSKLIHAESGLRTASGEPFAFSEDKARATLQEALVPRRNDPDAGRAWLGVTGAPGALEGSVYLRLGSPWGSEAAYLLEFWNYVMPQYRKSSMIARRLIAFSTARATALGLPLVTGVMSTAGQAARQRFYERELGFKAFGQFYVHHVGTV